MRAAVAKACAGLGVERFVTDLDRDVCVEASGAELGADARVWSHRFRSAGELFVPAVVLPAREDFWFLTGRRVRALKSSTRQKRGAFFWGSPFRPALKLYRIVETHKVAQCWERGGRWLRAQKVRSLRLPSFPRKKTSPFLIRRYRSWRDVRMCTVGQGLGFGG